ARREIGRDLVRLHSMLQRLQAEVELLREAYEGEELILTIAVRLHAQVFVQDVHDRLHAKVASRRQSLAVLLPPLPRALIVARRHEVIANDRLRPHARVGVATLATLRVLSQRELHRARDRKST